MSTTRFSFLSRLSGEINIPHLNKILVSVVALYIYCWVFYLPFTPFFHYSDQLIALYLADLLIKGQSLYTDVWDFIFPGAPVFYALLFAIFGTKYWVANAAVVATGAILFWLILRISKEVIHGPLYLLPAFIYIFFGYRWLGIDGYHRIFSPIFILIAIWILLGKSGFRNCLWAGTACAAASFFTQQRGLIALGSAVLFVGLDGHFRNEQIGRTLKSAGALCLGFSLGIFLLCGYFIFDTGAVEFFYNTIVYPAKYYHYAPVNNSSVYLSEWKEFLSFSSPSELLAILPVFLYTVVLPLTNVAAILLFFFHRPSREWAFWRGPILCLIFGITLMVSTTGPSAYRLFQIAAPSLIAAVWLMSWMVKERAVQRAVLYPALGSLLILGAVQAVRMQTHWKISIWDTPTGEIALIDSPNKEAFLYLEKTTEPGDYFFDPIGPGLLFPLQLRNPTRYHQFLDTDYTRPEMVSEAMLGFRRNPPRYIQWHSAFSKPPDQRQPGDHLAPLYEFLLAEYKRIGEPYGEDGLTELWIRKDLADGLADSKISLF